MWNVKIKVTDVTKKEAKITAIRTDDLTGEIYTYYCLAIIASSAQRSAVLQQIKDNYLDYLNYLNDADGVIAGLEDTATNSLNSWNEQ